ncbi:NAD-dependent epimerase/dehydratase family protein [bacterium]|nr:NAD-dependent epimerase/dehydratase family protein [bacterium]
MKALVTGGGGFLGKKIILQLLERGNQVRSFSRGTYPALQKLGVELIRGDLNDLNSVKKACENCDAVFHVAGRVGFQGAYKEFFEANVQGTLNIIEACRTHGIPKLIYTSSPSVIFDGKDQEGIDERAPHPEFFMTHYQSTKAEAEKYILEANDNKLATVSLRPHLIWGPGDPHLIPRILKMRKEGKLRFIGKALNLIDAVFIDNAAMAHLAALDRLEIGSLISGKAYFVTNQEPWPIKKIINRILEAANLPVNNRHIPVPLAYVAGSILEVFYRVFHLSGEPRLTRFTVSQLSKAHWYDASRSQNELGYRPKISMDEGFEILRKAFQ